MAWTFRAAQLMKGLTSSEDEIRVALTDGVSSETYVFYRPAGADDIAFKRFVKRELPRLIQARNTPVVPPSPTDISAEF